MSDLLPFCLYEAVLSLYPMAGEAVVADPVWCGAVANGLRLTLEYDEQVGASSGERYATAHHLDEHHGIEVERTWLLRKPVLGSAGSETGAPVDAVPGRNQRYALEIVWASGGYWYRRWYWGVTARTAAWESQRVLHFGSRQSWRAERFTEEGGYVPQPIGGGGSISVGGVTTPLSEGSEQAIGFFREGALVAGDYLLGRYRWAQPVRATSARIVALAPQGSAVVVGLEVNGALTGDTLTIPVGVANTEVSAEVELAVTIPALADVRWKVVSGPAPVNSAWAAAAGMSIS